MRRIPVPTDDLSSIPGLEEKHLEALAELQVNDLRSLADADQHEIHKAMANIKPRPTLKRIAQWQEEARRKLEEAATGAPDRDTVASFAVNFRQRRVGDAWERHVGVERTEVEPPQDERTWPGWEFEPIGRWMADQLAAAESASTPEQPVAAQPEAAQPEAQPAATKARGRSQLRIDSAAIVDANGTVDVVTGGELVADMPAEMIAPVRVVFTVSGARPRTVLHAVTRILRPDGPGWNPREPIVLRRSGQAEFDLSGIPTDQYEMSLIAWAPDATAKPVSVRLPPLTIRSGPG
jgi:hypothetical protein